MHVLFHSMPDVKPHAVQAQSDELLITLLNHFADQVDQKLQDKLVSELMEKYVEATRQLNDSNQRLKRYNAQLEELVHEKILEITASQMATIHALVKSAESRDDETGAHIERTALYGRLIAERLQAMGIYDHVVDDQYIHNIEMASPLHDIGKVGIADAVLLKPGRLTAEEFEIMKTHVKIGHETLAYVAECYPENAFIRIGMEISLCHHEKWDGSGYLYGLSGEDIPLSARIMAVSDVYDALRAKRVYKEPFSHEASLNIMAQSRGSHLDPLLTDVFLGDHAVFRDIFDASIASCG